MKWLLYILTAAMLMACSSRPEVVPDDDPDGGDCFISIAVCAQGPTTRADADEYEAALTGENTVRSILLILYQGTGDNARVSLARQFTVSGRTVLTGPQRIDVQYVTGPQALGTNTIDFQATYHALVIANAPELATQIHEGTTTLAQLQAMTIARETSEEDAFVMSSPAATDIDFSTIAPTNRDGTPHTPGNDRIYDLRDHPLEICRLAARIDFHTAGSTAVTGGYQYNVTGGGQFTVTALLPFNLRSDREYVFPHADGLSPAGATYDTPLASIYAGARPSHPPLGETTVEGRPNLIVAYARENTLATGTNLYTSATGLAIVGTYTSGTESRQIVYLGYLRDTGCDQTYDILPSTTPLSQTDVAQDENPYAVVRNHLYRVKIHSISIENDEPIIHLGIKVKKWDVFRHEDIYI